MFQQLHGADEASPRRSTPGGSKLKALLAATAVALSAAGAAQAATIDFTDGVFTPFGSNSSTGAPTSITETVDGITFTILPNAGGGGVDVSGGLRFAAFSPVPMRTISISADQSVRFTSITGQSSPVFSVDYSAPDYGPFNIGFSVVLSEVGLFGGGVELDPGQSLLIDGSDFFFSDSEGVITAIGFDAIGTPPVDPGDGPTTPTAPAPIPLPASGLLLAAGLAGLASWRRRRAS